MLFRIFYNFYVKYILEKFLSKNIISLNSILFSRLDNNLYEYNNIKDILLNYNDDYYAKPEELKKLNSLLYILKNAKK